VRHAWAAVALAAAALGAGLGAGNPQTETQEAGAEALVQRTCTACHVLPPPDVLPRRAWRNVVVDMTGLLIQGIGLPPGQPRPSTDYDIHQVFEYFERRAPEALPSPSPWPSPGNDPGRFVRHALELAGSQAAPAVANVRFVSLEPGAAPQVVAADLLAGLVLAGDPRRPADGMRRLGRVGHPAHLEAVDLDRDGLVDLLVADLGVAKPGDELQGSVTWLRRRPGGTWQAIPLAAGLPRVADVQAADFDGDGDLDLVVAAFGWRKVGGILLLENRTPKGGAPAFVKRELDARPGAIHVPVADLDRDGRPDFVALLSQQHESVVAFLGDGKGSFRQELLDRAPHPAWGSSGLQLVDLDRDGDLDALVTNGDMLDDFQLKPYHGIRWLENTGAFPFVAHELAPMFGVIRAQAADLDGDGDQDVVACALVQFKLDGGPPTSPPSIPSLVWLEQTAPGRFERHTLETGRQHLSLDLADYDADGDVDIAVANSLSSGHGFVELWRNQPRR
jgi:VCBS repeat protein